MSRNQSISNSRNKKRQGGRRKKRSARRRRQIKNRIKKSDYVVCYSCGIDIHNKELYIHLLQDHPHFEVAQHLADIYKDNNND